MKITLVDLHGSLCDAAKRVGWGSVEGIEGIALRPWTDVKDIAMERGMAFVSPANSLGFMDGGIDFVLSRVMFPGIEASVKAAYRAAGHVTLLGRPYLPIGQAVALPTQVPGVSLISAPTMWLPQNVRDTRNAYHAMHAILRAARAEGTINHIVLCGLCTGCGMMSPDTALAQMRAAHEDFCAKPDGPPRFSPRDIVEEQPRYYQNSEWKHIDPRDIRR
jgi:O-acetyl-ADP-ribose deacetylase (regulator of RNase III)